MAETGTAQTTSLAAISNPARPEIERMPTPPASLGTIEKKLSSVERIWGNEAVRKFTIVIVLLALWQISASWYNKPLSVATAWSTHLALLENLGFPLNLDTTDPNWSIFKLFSNVTWKGIAEAPLILFTFASLKLLAAGYTIGVALACTLSIAATFTRLGRDALETLTAMFSPLPAIALVPLALIWFGLGNPWAMIFVLVHSVLWPVALNTHSGFRASGTTLRMVGQNYALGPIRFVFKILIPAAFPAILTGLKVGWAFAWRTLIAAELVFGVNGDQGGLGWFIYSNKNNQNTPEVFAGLLMVIIIGLLIENAVFRPIEYRTVRKWGMQA